MLWVRRGKYAVASRVSWEIHFGNAGDLCVCHRCDNRSCVNPAHLFRGTKAENTADRDAKGRQAKGARQWCTKLDERKVEQIRNLRSAGWTYIKLAEKFGVSHPTIGKILHWKTWKHA